MELIQLDGWDEKDVDGWEIEECTGEFYQQRSER